MTDKDYKGHGIQAQAIAARELVQALGELADDDEIVDSTIEGETDFFEAVERALDEIAECEILQKGIADIQEKLRKRMDRVNGRSERLRGLIDQAFQVAGVKSHTFAAATVSTKSVPAKLIVTDEAQIPSKFFAPQPPKLDRKALLAAVKDQSVPGAELSNGGQTIQIRRD